MATYTNKKLIGRFWCDNAIILQRARVKYTYIYPVYFVRHYLISGLIRKKKKNTYHFWEPITTYVYFGYKTPFFFEFHACYCNNFCHSSILKFITRVVLKIGVLILESPKLTEYFNNTES